MTTNIRTLRVIRRGYPLGANSVGYSATVPPMDLPDFDVPTEQAPLDIHQIGRLLKWEIPVPPGARIEKILPVGMAASTRWETLYLQWLSKALGAPLADESESLPTASGSAGPAEVAACLDTVHGRFWPSPDQVPEGVRLVRAETRRGEARHAARTIRSWLSERCEKDRWESSCDNVLVLLPADPSMLSLWIEVFESLDLPVRTTAFRSMALDPFVQWVMDLARLAGWSDQDRKPRSLLQRILLPRFWSAKAAGESLGLEEGQFLSRGQLAELLRALRRSTVSLSEWTNHVLTYGIDDDNKTQRLPGRKALVRFTKALADNLAPETIGASLNHLLGLNKGGFRLGVQAALMSLYGRDKFSDDEWEASDAAVLLARVRQACKNVSPVAESDGSPVADAEAPLVALIQKLQGEFVAERLDPLHGVTFLPYTLFDHRKSSLLIMAGLGEGQFPSTARLPSENEVVWLQLLGLLDVNQPASRWVVMDAETQIQTAQAALRQADRAVLSFSTEGPGTEEVHPGALLSLLAGSWNDHAWTATHKRVVALPAGTDIPTHPGEAVGWQEARLFAGDETTRSELQAAAETHGVGVEEAHSLNEAQRVLGSSREADAQRNPEQPIALGAYTGRLPGAIQPKPESGIKLRPYSPTSLEKFGQCPYQYFLGRVLRLQGVEDAGDELDPLETGSTIHAAFAEATRHITGNKEGAVWDLTYAPGMTAEETEANRQQKIIEVMDELRPRVSEALALLTRTQPTLSAPLLTAVGVRWNQAIDNWVKNHVKERIPVRLDDEAIDASPKVAAALENLERAIRESSAATQELKDAVHTSHPKDPAGGVGGWKKRLAQATGESQTSLVEPLKDCFEKLRSESDWESTLDAFCQERIETAIERATERLTNARTVERELQKDFGAARKVAFAELSFGRAKDEESDPHSLVEPWSVTLGDGRVVQVTGQIDRVDWDEERSALAIRDYKSGRSRGATALQREMRKGLHLQLLLYACAVEDLLVHGSKFPAFSKHRVLDVALEFPKQAKQASVNYSDEVEIALPNAEGGEEESETPTIVKGTWRQVILTWLEHFTRSIEEGRFDLLPQKCPLVSPSGAYCDFKRICRFSKDHASNFEFGDARPEFAEPTKEKKAGKQEKPPGVILPTLRLEASDPQRDREMHKAGQDMAGDLGRNVIVSAGAGTGKTWNLVRRYLAALDSGIAPEEILCVTFTRKAAAEMRQRVRAGLLERASKSGNSSLSLELREKILTLSAAPIWTLDSLALHLLTTLHEAKGDLASGETPPSLDPTGASAELEQFLSDRFLQALQDGGEDIDFLLTHVTVSKLRGQLKDVVESASGIPESAWPTSAEEVLAGWEALLNPIVEQVRAYVRTIDTDEWQRLLGAESESISANNVDRMQRAIDAARLLAGTDSLSVSVFLENLHHITDMPASQKGDNGIGNKALYAWLKEKRIKSLVTEALGIDSDKTKALKAAVKDANRWPLLADVAYRSLKLCREWSVEFEARLRKRGTLRFGDVEASAVRALGDEKDAALLKDRLPFKHIFVDESQDTSERQSQMVQQLAALTDATLFWVGDPKQSIYRFRGAEVDVFEGRVDQAENVASLRVNYRSHARLIDAINRLFGAMFEAKEGSAPLDPGSEVQFEPQTWPSTHRVKSADGTLAEVPWVLEDEPPRIEWIVEPQEVKEATSEDAEEQDERHGNDKEGQGKEAEDDDLGDREDTQQEDNPPAKDAVSAITIRVRQILDEFAARGKEPPSGHVALLVRTWAQAKNWSDALAAQGIACAVQGGNGLLTTPEADLLRLWIEASVLSDEVAFAGVLRGPGIAVSDAGLYCLRMGYGVTFPTEKAKTFVPKPPFRLLTAALGKFDPMVAVAAWNTASNMADPELATRLLQQDAEALARFRGVWAEFERRLQIASTADTLDWLIQRLWLETYWGGAVLENRQAVANLRKVVDVVREFEGGQGTSPLRLVRYLEDSAGTSDPETGGLDAGMGTPVVVTTAWQAKGREWPVVVLPDLAGFRLRGNDGGLGIRRVVQFDFASGQRGDVLHVPELLVTALNEPFEVKDHPVSALLRVYQGPAERAELRRLLYVAMTRAKEKLILVGGFSPKLKDGAAHSVRNGEKHISLPVAKDWSTLLGMCTGFHYKSEAQADEMGQESVANEDKQSMRPVLAECGPWTEGREVSLVTTEKIIAKGASIPEGTQRPSFDPTVVPLWRPVRSVQVKRENPSAQHAVDEVPPPRLSPGGWPDSKDPARPPFDQGNDAGTAFHKLMELWGFGGAGQVLDEELAGKALDQTDLGAPDSRAARTAWLLAVVHKIQSANASLLEELRHASALGNVFHEVPIRFDHKDNSRVEGTIDLLWKTDQGWHLLDYKAGSDYPHGTGDEPLHHHNLRKYYAQVSLYAEGLPSLVDAPLVDFGLWFVAAGLVVRWGG